jgi:hypothetical protein
MADEEPELTTDDPDWVAAQAMVATLKGDINDAIELDYAVHVALLAAFQLIMVVPEGPDRAALCDEARADLDVMLKAALTPDSVYEAIERRSRFKLVPKEPE